MFNKEKTYFKKKLIGVQNMVWDLEFKKFKTLYVREQIRKEYDALRSRLEILKTQINADKGKPVTDEFKRLQDQEVIVTKDISKKLDQMKSLDIEIVGAKPSAEIPDGHQGLDETVEALRELMDVTKKYLKQI